MRLLLFWAFIFSPAFIFSQSITFQKAHGDTTGVCFGSGVQQTVDNSYIITGSYETIGYYSKIDINGDTLWTKYWPNSLAIVETTADSGFVLCDGGLVKMNKNGDSLWTKQFNAIPGNYTLAAKKTNDKGFIIVGYAPMPSLYMMDATIIKTDSIGNFIWMKTYGDSLADEGFEYVEQTKDGGYICVGVYDNIYTSVNNKSYLVRIKPNGDTLWTKVLDLSYHSFDVNALKQTSDGGYIIVGNKIKTLGGQTELVVTKIDSVGNIVWNKNYNGFKGTEASAIVEISDSSFAIAGSTNGSGFNGIDVFLMKINSNGDTIWTKTYGDPGVDIFGGNVGLKKTSDKGFILVGSTFGFGAPNGKSLIYVIKTDSTGYAYRSGTTDIINTTKNNAAIKIYPNPSTNIFNVEATGYLEIYNTIGEKIIAKQLIKEKNTIDLGNQPKGIYFFRIISDNKVITEKVIHQ